MDKNTVFWPFLYVYLCAIKDDFVNNTIARTPTTSLSVLFVGGAVRGGEKVFPRPRRADRSSVTGHRGTGPAVAQEVTVNTCCWRGGGGSGKAEIILSWIENIFHETNSKTHECPCALAARGSTKFVVFFSSYVKYIGTYMR